MTNLLHFPVLAIAPSGVDVYENELELTTCHRRTVRSTYGNLLLIDSDGDSARVTRYRAHPLPPKLTPDGRLKAELARIDLALGPVTKLSVAEVANRVLEALAFDESPTEELAGQIRAAESVSQLIGLLQTDSP